MQKKVEKSQGSTSLADIPDGFVIRVGPGDKEYLVPLYMVPALDQAFAAYQQKVNLEVSKAQPEASRILLIGPAPPFSTTRRWFYTSAPSSTIIRLLYYFSLANLRTKGMNI